ncbi:MAG TPA: type II toxin-antitoxin system RelE/ParE family toxin [Kofleriaceae bacterium]|nr:type II toxin-antitoxin system RelE/ParE family toxin [Kofleriaceae bacterium]
MKPYRFHRDARTEYRAALAWYATRSLDAADGFADEVAHGIRRIRELPAAWPMWRGRADVRARVMQRYPYSIVYVVRDSQIVIIAVAHQRRRPGYWLSRMQR